MTFLDKAIAAITPPESEEARQKARRNAESIATPGGWLRKILVSAHFVTRCFRRQCGHHS